MAKLIDGPGVVPDDVDSSRCMYESYTRARAGTRYPVPC
jgi:hypothetical protein